MVYEDDLVKCIMDAYPNVDGPVLILPKKHHTDYTTLPNDYQIKEIHTELK